MSHNYLTTLQLLNGPYAFYTRVDNAQPVFLTNCADDQHLFPSASIIKIPILLAWLHLEQAGMVNRAELCDLDAEAQVQGAGFSWLLKTRQLPYQDLLLLMLSLSDNLSANLIIRRAGIETLNQVFQTTLGLKNTRLQRKMLDFEARQRGLDNWTCAADCIHLFDELGKLSMADRAWVDEILAVNQDTSLLMRELPRDAVLFHHKTGSLPGVLHDWGYTRRRQIFLLTQGGVNELAVTNVFGEVGRQALLEEDALKADASLVQ